MEIADIAAFLTQFGTPGIMVAYLVWREREERKYQTAKDALDRASAEKALEKQHVLDRERIEADLEVARSLTMFTAVTERLR